MVTFLRILLYGWLGGAFVIFAIRLPMEIDPVAFAGLTAAILHIALIGVLVRALVRCHRRRVQVPRATAAFRSDRAGW